MVEEILPRLLITPRRTAPLVSAPALFSNRILTAERVLWLLRLSLSVVFFWFGMLKLINQSPVVDLLQHSFPFLAVSPWLQLLGFGEIVIAVGLAIDRCAKYAAGLMVLHLIGTLSVAIISPHLIFAPVFPILTMTGEFLAKNVVLIMAGLAVISTRSK